MRRFRGYAFEFAWLLLLIVIFLFAPARSSASAFDWADFAFDCSSDEGWCVPFRIEFDMAVEYRSLP